MKKKILALLLTAALCLSLAVPCFAASKPAVEVMRTSYRMNSVGGVEPTIYYRNNSGKTIKYIDWYLTAYNAVGDPVRCDVGRKSTIIAETVGPIPTFIATVKPASSNSGNTNSDDPFHPYNVSDYYINVGSYQNFVYSDVYGNLFTYSSSSSNEYTYLTNTEANDAIYGFMDYDTFEVCWYNTTIRNFRVVKAVVTFMDGSKTTVSGNNIYSKYYNHTLTNRPFAEQLSQYSSVYNYSDYMKYNSDLVASFGGNQKVLFEHFINSGMKEGRRASSEFDLAAYKANNPDLVALFGDDNAKYYEHYIAGGKAEGRVASSDTSSTSGIATSNLSDEEFAQLLEKYAPVYNAKDYIRFNINMATLANDKKALFEHFLNSGMKEGRQASSEFNLAAYRANNPDLVALFGDDNVKYYEHYMAGGKAEGRKAV